MDTIYMSYDDFESATLLKFRYVYFNLMCSLIVFDILQLEMSSISVLNLITILILNCLRILYIYVFKPV